MITESRLQKLAGFEPTGSPVVSLYLNVDPKQRTSEAYKLRLRGLLKGIDEDAIRSDTEAITSYFDHEYDWSGRSVVLFSSQESNFWETYPLAVPLPKSHIVVAERPFIRPLVRLFDQYGSYAVALVDQLGARLFDFHMGQLAETSGTMGEEVRRLKKGGGSSRGGASRSGGRGGSQREKEVAAQNLRDAADLTTEFFEQRNIKHLLIAGTEQVVAQFRELLPSFVSNTIVGTFTMEMAASGDKVLERSLQIVQDVDQQREAKLVSSAITAAAKGSNGVIRLDDTLGVVSEGRVQTLLVSDGFAAPGYQCNSCSYMTTQSLSACPFCGGQISEISDAVELAIRRVTEQGGSVEIIEQKEKLDEAGGIAALLRY